ncbi:MAG: GTP-binding DUF697 domain-containing protein [Hyphomonadaceae bacterium]|jgi:uncharacterized protein (DUF697 family)|nr:GTP-binding DUF697 domain-containing protein [Hyphomonadaceae bacterium]
MSRSDDMTHIADSARQFAAVVWLLGKVQSGKTSIVRTLTQATDAEIGAGFRACTRTARVFDFPDEAPIIRFLDTRGLGEAGYDPAADIAFGEDRAHLILAVVKALDADQHAVLDVIRQARRRHPDWPVVVAQTNLHEGYPAGGGHILPYPFENASGDNRLTDELTTSLRHQQAQFRRVLGEAALSFVPIDFTQPEDGFAPVDYGREALVKALIAAAPAGVAVALAELPDAAEGETDAHKADAHIMGFAVAAGASDAVPVAGAIAVPIVQAAMLRQLAKLHGMQWDRRAYAQFLGALGAGTLVRTASTFGIRQLVKLVPGYGQTIGAGVAAAASFATTYAIGKAATYFLARHRRGARADEVAAIYRETLQNAFRLAKQRQMRAGGAGGKP